MKRNRGFFIIAILLLLPGYLLPQEDVKNKEKDLSEMSLEELVNLEISVASKTSLTMRKAPGIVTLLTKEDITRSGARDLIDVLRLVPGIDFGH